MALHSQLDAWLNDLHHLGPAEPWNPQRRWDMEVANLLVQLLDCLVAGYLGAECLLMDTIEAARGETMFPSGNYGEEIEP